LAQETKEGAQREIGSTSSKKAIGWRI